MTLPTNAPAGVEISVEKVDASLNTVTVSGTLRGVASSIALSSQYEGRTFLSEGNGSWRPVSDHRTQASLDAAYVRGTQIVGTATAAVDGPALQAAVNASAVSGVPVVLLGSHKVSTTITVPTGAVIEGRAGASLTQTANLTPLFDVNAASGVRIRGLRLVGVGTDWTNVSGNLGMGIRVRGASSDIKITDCRIENFGGYGVRVMDSAEQVSITNNTVIGPGATVITSQANFGMGVSIEGTARKVLISNNLISAAAQGIITGNGTNEINIVGNEVFGIVGQHGMYLAGSSKLAVTSNLVHDTVLAGIKVQLTAIFTAHVSGVAITGNTVHTTGDAGILITNTDDLYTYRFQAFSCTGNSVYNAGGCGILVGAVAGGVVSGNSIHSSSLHGMEIDMSDDLVVSDNIIVNSARMGLWVSNRGTTPVLNRIRVKGNTIRNPGTANVASTQWGIYAQTGTNLSIESNLISDSVGFCQYGIYINGADLATLVIIDNESVTNTQYGIRFQTAGALKAYRGNRFAGTLGRVLNPPTGVGQGESVVNVKDFGAVGDGVTNDTTAIQAAISVATALGGGTVYFPKATYAIAAGLTVNSNLILRGEQGATLLATATISTMMTLSSRTNVRVENLILDGASLTTTLASNTTCTGVVYSGVTFRNAVAASASGVRVNGGTDVLVTNCTFDTLARGVFASNNAAVWVKRVRVRDSYFTGMADAAVYCTGNQASVAASEDFLIDGCRMENFTGTGSTRSGIYFVVAAGATVKHQRTRVSNCTLIGRYEAFTAGTGNSDFITFYDVFNGSVTNCNVEGGGDVGISLSRSSRNSITGNITHHNQSFGIGLWDSSQNTVTGNIAYDNRANFGFSPTAVTWAAATDTFTTVAPHGLTDGTTITFPSGTTPAGSGNAWGTKFVRDSTATTFKVANTSGGTANDLTSDGSGVYFLSASLRGVKSGILCRITAGQADSNVITGNRCYDDNATKLQEYGVSVEAGCTNTLVVGNMLGGNYAGSVLDAGTGSLVANNL